MALYDALLAGGSRAERDANVRAVTARFFAMLDDAPRTTPSPTCSPRLRCPLRSAAACC